MQALRVANHSNFPRVHSGKGGGRLRRAIGRHDNGEIDDAGLAEIWRDLTGEVLRAQGDAGVDLATDGQIGWDDALTYLARPLGASVTGLLRFLDTNTYYRQPVMEQPLRWSGPITVDDWKAAAAASPVSVKAVLTGPYTLAALSAGRTLEARARECAAALNAEARALQDAGATVLAIEEPALCPLPEGWALFRDNLTPTLLQGLTLETVLQTSFGDISRLPGLLGLPYTRVGLDLVDRPANWEALRGAQGRPLAAGLVDARNTRLEDPRAMADAIDRLVLMGFHDLHLQPNAGLEFLPWESALLKLRALALARDAATPPAAEGDPP